MSAMTERIAIQAAGKEPVRITVAKCARSTRRSGPPKELGAAVVEAGVDPPE